MMLSVVATFFIAWIARQLYDDLKIDGNLLVLLKCATDVAAILLILLFVGVL